MKPKRLDPFTALFCAFTFGLCTLLMGMKPSVPADIDFAKMAGFLRHFDVVYLDDGRGNLKKTFQLSSVNLRLVNGLGATNGVPTRPMDLDGATNGLGNFIVGYNEDLDGTARTGSHNVVLGTGNAFSSWGGLVAGSHNQILGPYSSVTGGVSNAAEGPHASVSGGFGNRAEADSSSILGGANNSAEGTSSSVSGGMANLASGDYSSILGGGNNRAQGSESSVSGGSANIADGEYSSVLGGSKNVAQGSKSSASGGFTNVANGDFSSILGGTRNDAQGSSSTISGGRLNNTTTDSFSSSISGGSFGVVEGTDDWRAGGLLEDS